jgi:poly(hydroxyalkanoate) depolymerase family esterase
LEEILMNATLQQLMQSATRLTQSGKLQEATQVIRRALGLGTNPGPAAPPGGRPMATPSMVIDGCVTEVQMPPRPFRPEPKKAPQPGPAPRTTGIPGQGEFIAGSYTHASAGTRDYKLFVPPGYRGEPVPLVVMLHGCKQNPDDFAAGTGMNELAREQGFLVLYPAQAQQQNAMSCWNWFKHNHQQRGRGEPALLAGMIQSITSSYAVDARRVYVAGLSAGGAMAAIAAQTYPELFAAVGIHSGLPHGSAQDVMTAMSVMKSGHAGEGPLHSQAVVSDTGEAMSALQAAHVPAIVFHGDSDTTVHPRNGEQVIAAALETARRQGEPIDGAALPRVEQGVAERGRRYTRSTYASADGAVLAEHWVVHGAGHAWSGGNPRGSYTDPHGPDASQEMLSFFMAHPKAMVH